MTAPAGKVISVEPLNTADAKWISLVKIKYEDAKGKLRFWEATKRKTTPKGSLVDAIVIVAILDKPDGPELLLEKQFRPPADKVVVEFPAGLVDEGESAETAAVRELLEETGYVGEVLPDPAGLRRPVFHSSPASSSSCTYMIHMKIDLAQDANLNPKAQLQDDEFIECFSIPLKNLHSEFRRLEAQGYAIDGKVASFAEGIQVASQWSI